MNKEHANTCYAIIRYNVRTYRSDGVAAVVRGKQQAESALKEYQESVGSSMYHEGWRYFLEKTNLEAGTDPVEATKLRQQELELRESAAPEAAHENNFKPRNR